MPIGPGGTYDLYGRLGAEILEKHLPGKPQVITQLMTGGGGAVSTNYLANRSPKDGTALISLHGSAPQNQVLGVTGVSYDLAEFLMVGQFSPLNSSLTVWRATSPAHDHRGRQEEGGRAGLDGCRAPTSISCRSCSTR